MCDIFHDFQKENGYEPTRLDQVYDWAKKNNRYLKPKLTERAAFKHEMRRALRSEKIADDDGDEGRRNCRVRIIDGEHQLYLWGETLEIPLKHVQMSFTQRKLNLGAGAIRMERDVQFYNKHNKFGAQLSFSYDLTSIVEDSQHPTDYPDERPDDDDNKDA